MLTYSCIPTETSGRQTSSMRRRQMPNRPGVAAAAGEGGRSLNITSTRAAGNPGTAEQPGPARPASSAPDRTSIELVGELDGGHRYRITAAIASPSLQFLLSLHLELWPQARSEDCSAPVR